MFLSGYVFVTRQFIYEMENISYYIAAGKIDKDLLKEIICAVIEDDMGSSKKTETVYSSLPNGKGSG